MAENPMFCYICDQSHISKQSSDWCCECEEAFCADCLKHHRLSKLSKHHSTIPIDDFLSVQQMIPSQGSFCDEHAEMKQMFCQIHNQPLCLACLEEHLDCKTIIRLDKLTKDIKTSDSFTETEEALVDVQSNIKRIQEHLSKNLSDLPNQKEAFLKEIGIIRKKINDHLDIIEQTLKDEISEAVSSSENEITNMTEILNMKAGEIQKFQKQLTDLKTTGSELHTFFALRHISTEVAKIHQYIDSLITDAKVDKRVLKLYTDEAVSTISNIKSFGAVETSKISSNIMLENRKEKQAQLIGRRVQSIQTLEAQICYSVDVQGDLRGCCILPGGRIVLADHGSEDRLIVVSSRGKYLFDICVKPNYAFDVTCVGETTVAVSSGGCKSINIVDINSRKITNITATNNLCMGLVFYKGLLLCCVERVGIQKINPFLKSTETIVENKSCKYIDCFKNKMYYSVTNSVICCDMEGKTIWTFNDETVLKDARGIAVDNEENVYVASSRFESIIVLSPDGKQSKQLLNKESGILKPFGLFFDRKNNKLLVSNEKQACLFTVKQQ